ncbi:preprotein translocase subunit SecA [bacterium]|nr:preprotein translocase subunit SecA [bacterium]MBU1753425.1 preprotein translocase subunit SecA [bacterium]
MFDVFLKKLFGTKRDRDIKRLIPIAEEINSLEPQISILSDEELRLKTDEFKKRFVDGETLEDLLSEAFAVVREAGKRAVNMRHFDVQLMGGVVLHEGNISEMRTGEGKTLVATLAAYLNALAGKGVHVVTVNDYLAKRDSKWMGKIYEFLGLTIGVIQHDMTPPQRQQAYACDVTYGTNNEFGFDYLRDNMSPHKMTKVQRGHYFAVVDEVDSILIDEARTPLIISGPAEESTDKYYRVDKIVPYLRKEDDYQIEEKLRNIALTEEGVRHAEKLLKVANLYAPQNMDLVHHINQSLRAHYMFNRDVDYMVKDGQVVIIDEFTGRMMEGRRFSDGLHQALEAKEGVRIRQENQTLASITFQNYFRLYEKLSGMTGTADTEAEEFDKIYHLEVVVIPPNRIMVRADNPDVIYKTQKEKHKAIIQEISDMYEQGRPCLVGTISVDKSEKLSVMLKEKGIPHQVLNAKYHEMEAQIIAKAGHHKSVTVATNMAGRGTDIVLGEGIADLGGLHILGTERHESRRIDNQLRGRAGRQGDNGSSRFYLSLEDDLMRIFGSERISGLMERLGLEDDQVIEHPWITKAIERAQKQVEAHNFDVRKRLLEYDDIMNQQRIIIYAERDRILGDEDLIIHVQEILEEVLQQIIDTSAPAKSYPDEWDINGLRGQIFQIFGITCKPLDEYKNVSDLSEELLIEVKEVFQKRANMLGSENMNQFCRGIMLHVLDTMWKEHLHNMDYLKEGIHLRAYGQKDPLIEYKHESFGMFESMVCRMKEEIMEYIFKVQLVAADAPVVRHETISTQQQPKLADSQSQSVSSKQLAKKTDEMDEKHKLGRNDPCPCGSGQKYKKCHGK